MNRLKSEVRSLNRIVLPSLEKVGVDSEKLKDNGQKNYIDSPFEEFVPLRREGQGDVKINYKEMK